MKNKRLADAKSRNGRIKIYIMAYSPLAHHTNSSRFVVVVDLLSN